MIKNIYLENFRNHSQIDFHFDPYNNYILGNNGEGKTSILESIYFISAMKSFRQKSDEPLLKKGEAYFFIKSDFELDQLVSRISITYSQKKKSIILNNQKIPKISDAIGKIKVVIFKEDDLYLIYGSPSIRRQFIDFGLCLSSPYYLYNLQQYNLILKKKNYLLKSYPISYDYLDILNQKWISFSSQIIYLRYSFFLFFKKFINEYFSRFNFNKEITIKYKNPFFKYEDWAQDLKEIEAYLKGILSKNQSREIDFKQSLLGPHKDDFYICLNNEEAKNFASQGQVRVISFILKILLAKYMDKSSIEKSILLFDDFFLDLDKIRQKIIVEFFEKNQKIFTMTEENSLFKNFPAKRFIL